MERQANHVIRKFREGKQSFGMQMYIPSPELYECCGWKGFDFVMIDMEHTRINYETMSNLIRCCEMTNMTPFARVPSPEAKYIRYALEAGARGIVVPHVKSAEDVKKAQTALRFPPEGHAEIRLCHGEKRRAGAGVLRARQPCARLRVCARGAKTEEAHAWI